MLARPEGLLVEGEEQLLPTSELTTPDYEGSEPIEADIHHPTSSPIAPKSPAKVHKAGSRTYGKSSTALRIAVQHQYAESSDSATDTELDDEASATPSKKAFKPTKRPSNVGKPVKEALKSSGRRRIESTVVQSTSKLKSRSNLNQKASSALPNAVGDTEGLNRKKPNAIGLQNKSQVRNGLEDDQSVGHSTLRPNGRKSTQASIGSIAASLPVKTASDRCESSVVSSGTEQEGQQANHGQLKPSGKTDALQTEPVPDSASLRRRSEIRRMTPPAVAEVPSSPLTEQSPTIVPSSRASSPEDHSPLTITTSMASDQLQAVASSSAPATSLLSASARLSEVHFLTSPTSSINAADWTSTPVTPTKRIAKRRRSSPAVTEAIKKAKVMTTSQSLPSLASPIAGPSRLPMPIDSDSDMDELPKASQAKDRTPLKKREVNRWLSRSPTPLPWLQTPEKSAKAKEEEFRITELPSGVAIGDAIYVRNRQGPAYWPAVLEGFEPVQSYADKKKKRMTDLYLTREYGKRGKMAKKRRLDVIFMQDEHIADCKLGILEMDLTRSKKLSIQEEIEEEDEHEAQITPEEFNDLSFAKQLRRIRPHLCLVLQELYAPAQWRIEMLFAGARSRKALNGFAPFGDISETELEDEVLPPLRHWFLLESDKDGSLFSARIRHLSESMKDELINKVLVPEALIQLCIRSMGLSEDQSWLQDGPDQPMQSAVEDHSETKDAPPIRKPFDIPSGLDDDYTFQYKLYNQAYKTLVELTAQGDDWTRVLEELREARRMMRIIRKMPAEDGERASKEADQLQDDRRRRRKVTSFSGYQKH